MENLLESGVQNLSPSIPNRAPVATVVQGSVRCSVKLLNEDQRVRTGATSLLDLTRESAMHSSVVSLLIVLVMQSSTYVLRNLDKHPSTESGVELPVCKKARNKLFPPSLLSRPLRQGSIHFGVAHHTLSRSPQGFLSVWPFKSAEKLAKVEKEAQPGRPLKDSVQHLGIHQSST